MGIVEMTAGNAFADPGVDAARRHLGGATIVALGGGGHYPPPRKEGSLARRFGVGGGD
jgi:hypothetical protein